MADIEQRQHHQIIMANVLEWEMSEITCITADSIYSIMLLRANFI